MPFTRIAEERIRRAIAEGKFDGLSNAGRGIDLEEYFRTPADLRLAHSILKSANCVPEEVELLREIDQLERALANAPEPNDQRAARETLRGRRLRLAVLLERRRRRAE